MDRALKERLIGAAVLIAIAIIVIPELLSGSSPDSDDGTMAEPDETATGLKTYTIDLSRTGQTPADAEPAAAVPVASETPAVTSTEDGAAADRPARSATTAAPPDPEPTPTVAAAPAKPAADQPSAAPAQPRKTSPPAPRHGDWAVQVGSFSSRPAAEKVASQLERRGYRSFITEYRTGGRTLHRVRLGPVANREQADAMVRKLKGEGTTATVVANP